MFPVSITTSNPVSTSVSNPIPNPFLNNPFLGATVPNVTQFLPLTNTVNSFGAPQPDDSKPPIAPKRESHRSRSINRNRGGRAGAGGGEEVHLLDRTLELIVVMDVAEKIENQ